MKILKTLSLFFFSALLVISCGGANLDQMGGPGETPEDLIAAAEDMLNNVDVNALLESIKGTDETAEQNAAVEEESDIADSAVIPVTEEPAADDSAVSETGSTETAVSGETAAEDESAAEPEQVIVDNTETTETETAAETETDVAYTIDSSQGKWMSVPEKELFSEETEKSAQARIKSLRDEIKKISADIKQALKDKPEQAADKGKGSEKGKSDKENAKDGLDIEAAQNKILALRDEIAALREQIGSGGRIQSGIYTAWANQSLRVNIGNAEEGWYKLTIVAMNKGKLPESYDSFSFTVLDMSDEKLLGNISVDASDTVYNRGRVVFKLDNPKGKTLDVLWTNDYYKKEENVTYDANVQIKQIKLTKVKEPKYLKKTRLKGDQYSYLDGRWFFDKGTAWTAWANQTIGYSFHNLKGGKYELTVTAKNNSSLGLPKEYKEFNLEVNTDNASESVMIPAHDVKWQSGTTSIVLPEGDATIYLTWVNDSYLENEYDTNISIKSIKLKRTADSTLTAYLLRTTTGNRMMLTGILILLVSAIMGISFWNRKRMGATA